jgi:hypothetical protein
MEEVFSRKEFSNGSNFFNERKFSIDAIFSMKRVFLVEAIFFKNSFSMPIVFFNESNF